MGVAGTLTCQDRNVLTAAVCSLSAAATVTPVAASARRSSPAWLPSASSPPAKQALRSGPSWSSSRTVRPSLQHRSRTSARLAVML